MPHYHTRLYDYPWMFSNNFSHRVESVLVSLSEGNQISMFLWRKKTAEVLKILPSKTGSQNWILLLAEHENMLSHKKMEDFLCEKCVTFLISFFTLSPHLSIEYCMMIHLAGGYIFVHDDVLRLKSAESGGSLLASDKFLFFTTSELKRLAVNRDALLHASF